MDNEIAICKAKLHARISSLQFLFILMSFLVIQCITSMEYSRI